MSTLLRQGSRVRFPPSPLPRKNAIRKKASGVIIWGGIAVTQPLLAVTQVLPLKVHDVAHDRSEAHRVESSVGPHGRRGGWERRATPGSLTRQLGRLGRETASQPLPRSQHYPRCCRWTTMVGRISLKGMGTLGLGVVGVGVAAGRHRIRRLMRLMGVEATYRRPRTSGAWEKRGISPCRAPRSARGQAPVAGRVPLPPAGVHFGTCPSPAGGGPTGGASTPREHTAKAPEGSHNHSESTLTLPSDCPTK